MFEIEFNDGGEIVVSGRLDAAQAARAQEFFDQNGPTRNVDFSALEYMASAGLGVLLSVQQRLGAGHRLDLILECEGRLFNQPVIMRRP